LDYFLCSPALRSQHGNALILLDGDNLSDHLAISYVLNISKRTNTHPNKSKTITKLNWDRGDLNRYRLALSSHLSDIKLPVCALNCNGDCDGKHHAELQSYFTSLSSCLHKAAECSVPVYKVGIQKHWWTPELDELKQLCIDATAMWKAAGAGKPRSAEVNANRVRIKLKYKNAIKLAAANSDMAFNDELYNRLCKKDTNGFLKSCRKHFHMKKF